MNLELSLSPGPWHIILMFNYIYAGVGAEVNKNDGHIQNNVFKLYDGRVQPGVSQYGYSSRLRTVQACRYTPQ